MTHGLGPRRRLDNDPGKEQIPPQRCESASTQSHDSGVALLKGGDGAMIPARRTIYDVAGHAGVSLATVSRFMNGGGYVGGKTRGRIEAAIRELDYVPSQPARVLDGRGSVLGVRHLENPRWTEMARAMETDLRELGLSLVLLSIGTECERELAALEQMRRLRAEGVAIVMAHAEPGDFERLHVPPALPVRPGDLQDGQAAANQGRAGPPGRLSLRRRATTGRHRALRDVTQRSLASAGDSGFLGY